MRKLTVIQALPAMQVGGVERCVVEISKALAGCGHRCIVISAGGGMVAELIADGSEHITLDIGKKSLTSLRHISTLKALFRETGADIVHAHSRLPAWLCYLTLKGLPMAERPRFVTTVHGSYSINAYSGIMTRGEKIIAVSAFIQDYILNNYPRARPEDICHISGGVSTEEFPFAYQPDATWRENFTRAFPETRQKHLLTLPARITRRKGQIDFLHVLAGMLEKRQDIQGLIVGAPDARREGYARELKQLAHSLGLTKQISFTGHRDDLRNIMAISTLVYSLSRIPEAFGLTALEALSLGKPVIAYDHGGASEVLGTIYPTGLIPPEDRDQTIATSLAMLENPMPVPDTHPFTLEAMQVATIEMYESLFMNVKAG